MQLLYFELTVVYVYSHLTQLSFDDWFSIVTFCWISKNGTYKHLSKLKYETMVGAAYFQSFLRMEHGIIIAV